MPLPTLREQMALDLAAHFDTAVFAETVSYDDGTGPRDITALVDMGAAGQAGRADHATVEVKQADVPAPDYRHSFTIRGKVFFISKGSPQDNILDLDGLTWKIKVSADERLSERGTTAWQR